MTPREFWQRYGPPKWTRFDFNDANNLVVQESPDRYLLVFAASGSGWNVAPAFADGTHGPVMFLSDGVPLIFTHALHASFLVGAWVLLPVGLPGGEFWVAEGFMYTPDPSMGDIIHA